MPSAGTRVMSKGYVSILLQQATNQQSSTEAIGKGCGLHRKHCNTSKAAQKGSKKPLSVFSSGQRLQAILLSGSIHAVVQDAERSVAAGGHTAAA